MTQETTMDMIGIGQVYGYGKAQERRIRTRVSVMELFFRAFDFFSSSNASCYFSDMIHFMTCFSFLFRAIYDSYHFMSSLVICSWFFLSFLV